MNQSGMFEGQHHLVNRGRGHLEETMEISLGRRPAEDERVGVDESQVLRCLGVKRGREEGRQTSDI